MVIKILTNCLLFDSTDPAKNSYEATRREFDRLQKAWFNDQEPHTGFRTQTRSISAIKRITDDRQRRVVRIILDLDNSATPDDLLAFVAHFSQHVSRTNWGDLSTIGCDGAGGTTGQKQGGENQHGGQRWWSELSRH